MTVLDDLVINAEEVQATQQALTPPPAPVPLPPVDRLQKLFAITPVNSVPAQINHSLCTHEETDTARRRCRRAKIAAAGVAMQENKITIEHDGERWISTAAVRAEFLRLVQRWNSSARQVNEALVRLGQAPTQYNASTASIPIKVVFDVSIKSRQANDFDRYVERFGHYYGPSLRLKIEGPKTEKTRVYASYENEVLISSEERKEQTCQLLLTGTYSFNSRSPSTEKRIERVHNFVYSTIHPAVDSMRIISHNLDQPLPGQDDYELIEKWKELNNL